MSKHAFLKSISLIVGTIVGAGILGMPYVIAKAGFWTGMLDIIFLGAILLLIYLYLGEVCLRTRGFHQLPGYAERYLGKFGKKAMVFAMLFQNYGALIAYLIGAGIALGAIFNGNPFYFSIGYFVIMSLILYFGLETICDFEFFFLPLIIGVVFVILYSCFPHISLSNISGFNLSKILIPYGVILFAFVGAVSVPSAREELYKKEHFLKYAILASILICIAVYLLFSLAVIGVTGNATTEVATVGLGKVIGNHINLIGNILALITLTTSYLALGYSIKECYIFDYKVKKKLSWFLAIIVPFVFLLLGASSFIIIMSVSGVIAGGLEAILILLMALKVKKLGDRKPEYKIPINWIIVLFLIFVFVLGAGYYLYTLI